MSAIKDLLRELRRRRVFRMSGIYIVAAWVIVQVASEVFPAINIPDGAIRYVWALVVICFPLAVLFSWMPPAYCLVHTSPLFYAASSPFLSL